MSFGAELQHSLRAMGFAQLLLALLFVAGYALSLGSFVGPTGRRRAALLALLAAVGFCAFTTPWVHGVLLMAGTIGAIGVFIGVVMLLSRLFGLAARPSLDAESGADETVSEPLPLQDGAVRAPRTASRRFAPTRPSH